MEKHTVIGDRIDFNKDVETTFSMSFLPLDIFDNWDRVSSISDFVAEYFGTYYNEETASNIISTIFNELVENAVKFTKNNSQPIHIVVKKSNNNFLSRITNTIPSHSKDAFLGICRDLFSSDLDELFIKKIEAGVLDDKKSGIGLILLKKDYQVDTSFDFFEDNKFNKVAVTIKLTI